MEKINMLPLAEKIDDRYAYHELPEKKGFRLDLPFAAYIILFAGMVFALSQSITIGVCIFGAFFIILPLDKKTTFKRNGHYVRSTLWNTLPFLMIGATIIFFCMVSLVSEKEETETGATYTINNTGMMIIKCYIAFLIAIMVGRLIYLIVTAFAISIRKKRCTVPVSCELIENRFYGDTKVFTYYYEGEKYRFIDHEEQTNVVYIPDKKAYDITPDHVYIDPNAPEYYYSRQIFGYNSKRIKHYFTSLFLFLFFTSFFWIIPVFRYIVDHIYA